MRRRRVEAEHALEGGDPVPVGLALRPVDEVDAEGAEADLADGGDGAGTASGLWRRPRLASTWGASDCTPSEMRFTPAAA